MTRLQRRYLKQYGFRRRLDRESEADWLAAFIAHVRNRDMSAAYELQLNRPQADWTPADVDAFRTDMMSGWHGPREDLAPGFQAFPMLRDPGPFPTTDDGLRALAAKGREALCQMRREAPTKELAIMASVLLLTGDVLTTIVSRADRLAVLKMLARTQPVYGYLLAFDAFVHGITEDAAGKRATKTDAILVQAGSRTARFTLVRPYRLETHGVGVRVVFGEGHEIDADTLRGGVDPYAGIFVSVPPSAGAPS
jgi:hypothetical protein